MSADETDELYLEHIQKRTRRIETCASAAGGETKCQGSVGFAESFFVTHHSLWKPSN
ncbi:hypothetical protein GGP50_001663 [Salinibacter ruber]|nr:hypothetical protein [Salinibacter ruber]